MKMPQFLNVTCPACLLPIRLPVRAVTESRGKSLSILVEPDWDNSEPNLVEHVLADPVAHAAYLTEFDDDSASPDTSREYFLDLLGRIDGVTA